MEKTLMYDGAALLVAIFFISNGLLQYYKRSHIKYPSGPPSLTIVGHLHILRPPLHKALARIVARHGPVLLLHFGSRPVLLVSSLPFAKECLTKNDAVFADRPRLIFGKHFGKDHTALFVAPYGDHWRRLRRATTELIFSATRVDATSGVRVSEVRFMVRQLFRDAGERFQRVEVKSSLCDVTYNVVMQMIAGRQYESEGGRRLPQLIEEVFSLSAGLSNLEDFLSFLKWVGLAGLLSRRMIMVGKLVDEACQEIIEERRRDDVEDGGSKQTILDALLSLQNIEPGYCWD